MRNSKTIVTTLALFTAIALATALAGCEGKEDASTGDGSERTEMYVNDHCPIMGSAVSDPVPASLVREYKGGKVAFCCAACLPAWDKLSDSEKEAKLKAVAAP